MIKTSVVGPQAPVGDWDKGISWLRNNVTSATLVGNAWSILQQPLGAINAMGHPAVGVTGFAKATAMVASNPRKYYALVEHLAPGMGLRKANFDPNIADANNASNRWNVLQPIMKYGFTPQAFMQSLVDVPAFLSAFETYSQTMNDADASARAMQAVRDISGSGEQQELSKAQRTQLGKSFTMFATYQITVLNNLRRAGYNLDLSDPKTVTRALKTVFFAAMLPAAAQLAAAAALKDDELKRKKDETTQHWAVMTALRQTAALIPGIRDAAEGNPIGMPGVKPLTDIFKFTTSFFDDKEGFDLKAGINTVGGATGLPSSQVNKIIQAIMDPNETPIKQAVFGTPPR
jgi:hypothetical protein